MGHKNYPIHPSLILSLHSLPLLLPLYPFPSVVRTSHLKDGYPAKGGGSDDDELLDYAVLWLQVFRIGVVRGDRSSRTTGDG
jgi:hypothetical protein